MCDHTVKAQVAAAGTLRFPEMVLAAEIPVTV